MDKTKLTYRAGTLALVFLSLAGCKLLDDEIQLDAADTTSESDGSAPTIWGDPAVSVMAGTQYLYLPEADDQDGDVLEFSIENQPAWASFDAASGRLDGVPADSNVGEYDNIVISVTDQSSVVSLPSFSIVVEAANAADGGGDDGADTGNDEGGTGGDNGDAGVVASDPPTIAGTPNKVVVAGSQYVFRPDVYDPDNDDLSFSILHKPDWAHFNTTTGRLGGWPKAEDIGTSKPVEISVTDGDYVVALPRFTITVEGVGTTSLTLQWNAPTKNADGSPLQDLAGYKIYYGTASGDYNETVKINSAGITSYVIDDLAPGRYFLAMTSINSQNTESGKSGEIEVNTGG